MALLLQKTPNGNLPLVLRAPRLCFPASGGAVERSETEGVFADSVAPSERFAPTSPAGAGEDKARTLPFKLTVALAALAFAAACAPDKIAQPNCGLTPKDIGAFVALPAGQFVAGRSPLYPEEGPPQRLNVGAFEIQRHEVTNAQFAAFVAATGHVSDAERGGGAVFTRGQGWALVKGADWRHPEGPKSNILGKDNWPVVQVSHRDALAYAAWAKARLPDEMEWEYAASLGLPDPDDSRSGAKDAQGKPRANVWQGVFPVQDDGGDGFVGTAPVGCFAPDKAGLRDMIGNVWEWTATLDLSGQQAIIKGGSHLCADNFCGRYRPEARQTQDLNFSTNHIGFRVVREASVAQ